MQLEFNSSKLISWQLMVKLTAMFLQLLFIAIYVPANVTFIWHVLISMPAQMGFQRFPCGERLRTNTTFVWFFAGMHPVFGMKFEIGT